MALKRVIIVGGGYAGSALARALDGSAEVRLVESRDRFVHNVAAIRAVVDPSLVEKTLIPYDKLLRRGSVLHGKVTSIGEGNVTLADSVIVEGDIIVVATGSHYAAPFKPQTDAVAAFTEANRDAHAAVAAAKKIAIVGGGAVGVELAGEIATAFPKKSIALISATKTLLPAYSQKLSKALVRKLKAKGVSLHLGVRARNLTDKNMPFAGYVETDGGNIEADLIFPAAGARPVNALLRGLPGSELDALGRVKVDRWLRPAGAARIFALGDAAATGDLMTIVAITRQVPWLAKTIKALVRGRKVERLPAYTPWPVAGILVPLGPKEGASILPITRNGIFVGRRITSMLKGKDLFIPRYQKEFGRDAKQ